MIHKLLIPFALLLAAWLAGCELSVERQPDGRHLAAHWIDFGVDRRLTEAVKSQMTADASLRGSDFVVTSEDGHIYLEGATSNPEILAKAVAVALSTPGVDSVRCRVTIVQAAGSK